MPQLVYLPLLVVFQGEKIRPLIDTIGNHKANTRVISGHGVYLRKTQIHVYSQILKI